MSQLSMKVLFKSENSASVANPGDEHKVQNAEHYEEARKEDSLSEAPWLAEEEKKLVRKLDGRILPMVCSVYLFAREYAYMPHLF